MRSTTLRASLAILATGALLLAACGGDDNGDDDNGAAPDGTDAPAEGATITIRGMDFSESATIAQVYGQYLEAEGYDVDIPTPSGTRSDAFIALESDELNMLVDYIGGVQAELNPDAELDPLAEQVAAVIGPELQDMGFMLLDYSEAVNGDALVVRGDSEASTISDLADLEYEFGAAAECYERPQCYVGLTDPDVYGIEFADTQTIEFGPLLGDALAEDEVDVVMWSDTAPQIEREGFRVLEDDLGLFPAQNIAPILSDELVDDYGEDLIETINELSEQITTDDLVSWNIETDLEFREPDEVAEEWLSEQGLI